MPAKPLWAFCQNSSDNICSSTCNRVFFVWTAAFRTVHGIVVVKIMTKAYFIT